MPAAPSRSTGGAVRRSDTGPSPAQGARISRLLPRGRYALAVLAILAAAVLGAFVGFVARGLDLPGAAGLAGIVEEHAHEGEDEHQHEGEAVVGEDPHEHEGEAAGEDEHEHEHEQDTGDLLELSQQARKNLGLQLTTIELRDFQRTIAIPGILVDRPGRTEIAVSAPTTGIITRVHPDQGEAVSPGAPLFDMRLTHEDLVDKQSQFLQLLEERDVVRREVARLEKVTASGAVAGKQLLERQYEEDKIEAAIHADRQGLQLHGLTEEQIRGIEDNRRLLQDIMIAAPSLANCQSPGGHHAFMQVAQVLVKPGEHVGTGARLAVLTDHCQLYVEGKAFEEDADALNRAASQGLAVTALVQAGESEGREVPNLRILYVENAVATDSRALKFYVPLPNDLVRDETTQDGRRFVGWRYKPGQRVQLLTPVERWENRIVLPAAAVVDEGAERLVFRLHEDHFDRRPVHVEYRDPRWVVIANDGSLQPGETVASSGAYQMHLALKNKTGAAVDPHAGHNH